MAKDDSVVKSFRTTEEQFSQASEIFRKEGFSFSEVIRLLFEATIREGRIPRSLSTRDMESAADTAQRRENYVNRILDMVIPDKSDGHITAEERLLNTIFGRPESANDMTNENLRDWAAKWGLPENLSIATLADLHDCGLFKENPWFGDYDYPIDYSTGQFGELMASIRYEQNIRDNMEQVKYQMQVRAVNYMMNYDNEIMNNGEEN